MRTKDFEPCAWSMLTKKFYCNHSGWKISNAGKTLTKMACWESANKKSSVNKLVKSYESKLHKLWKQLLSLHVFLSGFPPQWICPQICIWQIYGYVRTNSQWRTLNEWPNIDIRSTMQSDHKTSDAKTKMLKNTVPSGSWNVEGKLIKTRTFRYILCPVPMLMCNNCMKYEMQVKNIVKMS